MNFEWKFESEKKLKKPQTKMCKNNSGTLISIVYFRFELSTFAV